jgi:hypothetical protein
MGNLCDGVAANNQKQLKNSRAYAEGVDFRFQGTAAAFPITGNPEDGIGSEAEACWDAGWTDAGAGTVEGCSARRGQTATA